MEKDSEIHHVSDTALWVAVYRGQEGERKDALFHDPLALVLAGERGLKIATASPQKDLVKWIMAIRTVAIDRLILKAIDLGVDAVINIGTGLDTRPYRMLLPADLLWIEVDFPHMIEFKNEKLKNEKPNCQLQRFPVDLSITADRQTLLANVASKAKKILVITEGVIPYLTPEQAAALSKDLWAHPSYVYWVQDYRQNLSRAAFRGRKKWLANAPMVFNVRDSLQFFQDHGWRILENITMVDESERLHRPLPKLFPWSFLLKLMPKFLLKKIRGIAGYVMYQRPEMQQK